MSGYNYCKCRDCAEITLSDGQICSGCVEAQCSLDSECEREGAYEVADENLDARYDLNEILCRVGWIHCYAGVWRHPDWRGAAKVKWERFGGGLCVDVYPDQKIALESLGEAGRVAEISSNQWHNANFASDYECVKETLEYVTCLAPSRRDDAVWTIYGE